MSYGNRVWLLWFFSVMSFGFSGIAEASDPAHLTAIINQVRGSECCEIGSVDHLKLHVETLARLSLPATFMLRYDAIVDSSFTGQLIRSPFELGIMIEITPNLASKSGVRYRGSPETWYEAQNAYLIGYAQDDRKKIIDTLMGAFRSSFGFTPQVTSAWMIDAWSLNYLHDEYGVELNQLTREQYSTDSYTLYGGPPNHPYFASRNWPIIPDSNSSESAVLIVRQTITDPVDNYGDTSSSFTSQPNDYLQNKDFDYFDFLFSQAHAQLPGEVTFACLGLETSMGGRYQDEFIRQLEFVADWLKSDKNNHVVPAGELKTYLTPNLPPIQLYKGVSYNNRSSQAWWITTDTYRARVRKSRGQLYISDLRIYDPDFIDPYMNQAADRLGWWIVPFSLDASRFQSNSRLHAKDSVANDEFPTFWSKKGLPIRIEIGPVSDQLQLVRQNEKIVFTDQNKVVATFSPNEFIVPSASRLFTNNRLLEPVLTGLLWKSAEEVLWGFNLSFTDFTAVYRPVVPQATEYQKARIDYYYLLFPELGIRSLDITKSFVYVNNRFAQAGRNPIRIIFYPKDVYGQPVLLTQKPVIRLSQDIDAVHIQAEDGYSGSVFIDLTSNTPKKIKVSISYQDFLQEEWVYFAPNCKAEVKTCISRPNFLLWYLWEKTSGLLK